MLGNVADGYFPSPAAAKQFLAQRTDISFGTKVTQNATLRRCCMLQESTAKVSVSTDTGQVTGIEELQLNNVDLYDEDGDDDASEKAKSIYSMNNATTDVPM